MNKCTIIGNLTRDPVVRTVNTYNGEVTVCSFGVAVNNRRGGRQNDANGQQQDATFFNVTAWRQLGENCAKFLAKGRKVCVVGPVSARTYQAQTGETRVSLEITAEDVEFLSSRNDDNGGFAPAGNGYGAPAAGYNAPVPAPTAQNSGFMAVDTDELPF